jgi:hypothetical protein
MSNKQTALQIFWDKIAFKLSVEQTNEFLPEFEQAKEIEKQQIIDAYNSGQQIPPFDYAEEYYTQTYGGQNNE